MILLSLASKQIWPHILLAAHLKPERLFLLHSQDKIESQGPAQRLKRLLDQSALVPPGHTRLEPVSDTDFHEVEQQLDQLQLRHQLQLSDCVLNFTGGNKLMATAAFRWAARRGLRACYLERRHRLTWFAPRDGDIHTETEVLDPHLTDTLDPLALLRCHLEASEIQNKGHTLSLNRQGQECGLPKFLKLIQNGHDPNAFLQPITTQARDGDRLELSTAAILLKLGVHAVQRGLRLKVKSVSKVSTSQPHLEIDLLFNWGGRLWLVDCKDRRAPEDFVHKLRKELRSPLSESAHHLLNRIASELSISQTKVLKEDLLAIHEIDGLLGQILCIRKAPLPPEVEQYAKHNHITVIYKNELAIKLPELINPPPPEPSAPAASPVCGAALQTADGMPPADPAMQT